MKQNLLLFALIVCSARSVLGRYYYAIADSEGVAQAHAIEECQKHSAWCYATGCHMAEETEQAIIFEGGEPQCSDILKKF